MHKDAKETMYTHVYWNIFSNFQQQVQKNTNTQNSVLFLVKWFGFLKSFEIIR